MADASQLQLNPYALFDPSQWANPYSNFQSRALPAASYAGWPTDAMGNPIQPQPGMTINQTPTQPAAPAAAAPGGPWQPTSLIPQALQAGQNVQDPNRLQMIRQNRIIQDQLNPTQQNLASMYQDQAALARMGGAASGGQAAAPQQGANAAGLTPQQYMALRANPGPVPTYGATVPQSSGAQPGSGVLQQFLQNWKPAQGGPGAGFQQGFASALRGMGY